MYPVAHSIRSSGQWYHCLVRDLLENLTSDVPVSGRRQETFCKLPVILGILWAGGVRMHKRTGSSRGLDLCPSSTSTGDNVSTSQSETPDVISGMVLLHPGPEHNAEHHAAFITAERLCWDPTL